MAEGGEDFGHEDPDLDYQLDNDDDDDEEQEVNRTQPSQPDAASTPYHRGEQVEMQTMQHEQSGLPSFEGTPLLSELLDTDEKQSRVQSLKDRIIKKWPRTSFIKLGPMGYGKKAVNANRIVVFGERGGETPILRKDGSDFLKSFTDSKSEALGPRAEDIIAEDRDTIEEEKQRLEETQKERKQAEEKVAKDQQKAQELQEVTRKLERERAQLDEIRDEHGSDLEIEAETRRKEILIKNYLEEEKKLKKELASSSKNVKKKEELEAKEKREIANVEKIKRGRNAMQERLNQTKTTEELKEQESKLQRQNAEDQAIIQDENASPSDKQAAEDRMAERNEELPRLQAQIAERERARPLLERIKEIFKKYGVTVASVLLAAGVTIGVVVSTVTNALKASTKALGKGLKDIGAKLGSLLPGPIGLIANFLFKAAGQAIGFLAEHTWLLILALVAFLFENNIKKKRR